MDSLTKEKRSWNMSRIRSNDTTPELAVRSFLFRHGFRFRLHVKSLPGHPDIVLPKYKTVIEVQQLLRFAVVFGIGIPDADRQPCRPQMLNSGRRNSNGM